MEVLILFSYFPLVNTPKVKAIKGISFCKMELIDFFLGSQVRFGYMVKK